MIRCNADEVPYARTALSGAIFEGIEKELANCCTDRIKILSISSCPDDWHNLFVTLELPGAVVMEIDCDLSEDHDSEYGTEFDSNVAEVVSLVSDFISGPCRYHGFQKIAELFDNARRNARKEIAQWSEANDAHIQLIDMRLYMGAYWRHSVELPTRAEFSYLDESLRPSSERLYIFHPDEIVKELQKKYSQIQKRTAALQRFQHAGADGEIDLIAINALRANGSIEPQLRQLQKYNPRVLGYFNVDCGRIFHSGPIAGAAAMAVVGDRIRILEKQLPDTVLANMPGKPITDFIECPILSADMTILRAHNDRGYNEGDFLELTIEQPRLFYCRSAGSYWK